MIGRMAIKGSSFLLEEIPAIRYNHVDSFIIPYICIRRRNTS